MFSLSSLNDIAETLTSTGDFNATLRSLLHLVSGVLTISKGAVLLYDPTSKILTTEAARGLDDVQPNLALDSTWVQSLTDENRPLLRDELQRLIPDLNGERDRCYDNLRSYMWVPLVSQDHLVGILSVSERFHLLPFGEQDLSLLANMARHIAVCIYNNRLVEEKRAAERYSHNVMTSIASGVITTGLDGYIVSANEAAERILNTRPAMLVGTLIHSLADYLDNDEILDLIKSAEGSGMSNHTSQMECKVNGRELVIDMSVAPLHSESGKLQGLVIALDDLSEERRIRSIFKRYVSDTVVDMALRQEEQPALGGEHRDVVVVFTDLRGFTRMQAEQGPEATMAMLNEYYESMVEVITRHNGTLSRIAGDGLMIIFGAPVDFDDKMNRALSTVLDMRIALEILNERRTVKGKEPLGMGIGISSGPVLAGNVGARQRMEYTVIGDSVNLAARLVDIADAGQILISDEIHPVVQVQFHTRAFRTIRMKGKTDPVPVYELLGPRISSEEAIATERDQTGNRTTQVIELNLPMIPDMELTAGQTAAAVAEFMGLPPTKVEEVRLALIEACINAIEHSNSKDRKFHISISMEDDLVVLIQDFGDGFEADSTRDQLRARASRETLLKRGWGLKLMEEMMDEVEVRSGKKGTTIRMMKKR